MPNHCENWVRLTGPKDILSRLEGTLFQLDAIVDIPEAIALSSMKERDRWITENWGTKWIHGDRDDGLVCWAAKYGGLEASFASAWAPPIPIYNRFAVKYGVELEYEYSEYMMCFAGWGKGQKNGTPVHYTFNSKEEMDEVKAVRQWRVNIWNPHFEGDQGRVELEEKNEAFVKEPIPYIIDEPEHFEPSPVPAGHVPKRKQS